MLGHAYHDLMTILSTIKLEIIKPDCVRTWCRKMSWQGPTVWQSHQGKAQGFKIEWDKSDSEMIACGRAKNRVDEMNDDWQDR